MANQQVPIIYECRRCWAILPYLDCPHNCPGADIDEQDEAFEEDLLGWKEELEHTGYVVDEIHPKLWSSSPTLQLMVNPRPSI